MGISQIHDDYLIFPVMNQGGEIAAQGRQFARIQLAEEHAELRMVAMIGQCLKDPISTLVVGDVIGDEKMSS